MEAILVTATLLTAIALLVYKYLTWHHGIFKELGLYGPKPNIFFGNFPSIITGKKPLTYAVDEIYNKYRRTHRAIGVFLARYPQILILDPELALEIMVKKFGKYRGNAISDSIYDRNEDTIATMNPFFTSDDTWKTKRSDVIGALSRNRLSQAFPIWRSCAKKLSKYIEKSTAHGNAIIETKDLAVRYTSNVLGEFIWGIETNTLLKSDEPNVYLQMSQKWLGDIFLSLENYFKFLSLPWLRRFVQPRLYAADTDRFFSQLTRNALELREKDASAQKRVDFLNYLRQLQAKKNVPHDDIVGHIMTTYLDGYETSATVLSHTIFYLAHHPEYQEKLQMELLENLDEDGFISYQKLCSLPYMDQCVHETIRLIPALHFYTRVCTEPTELEVGNGLIIPISVDQVLNVPTFSYHHDPDYFPQPYVYNPERFNNKAHLDLMKNGKFMPFGNGPRICVGMHLGLLQIKVCLLEILKAYKVKCCAATIPEKRPDSATFIMAIDGEFLLEYERL